MKNNLKEVCEIVCPVSKLTRVWIGSVSRSLILSRQLNWTHIKLIVSAQKIVNYVNFFFILNYRLVLPKNKCTFHNPTKEPGNATISKHSIKQKDDIPAKVPPIRISFFINVKRLRMNLRSWRMRNLLTSPIYPLRQP